MKRSPQLRQMALSIFAQKEHKDREKILKDLPANYEADEVKSIAIQFRAMVAISSFLCNIDLLEEAEAKDFTESFLFVQDNEVPRPAIIFELLELCRSDPQIKTKILQLLPEHDQADLVRGILENEAVLIASAIEGKVNFFQFIDPQDVEFLSVKPEISSLIKAVFDIVDTVEKGDLLGFRILVNESLKDIKYFDKSVILGSINQEGLTLLQVAHSYDPDRASGNQAKELERLLALLTIKKLLEEAKCREEEDIKEEEIVRELEQIAFLYPTEFVEGVLANAPNDELARVIVADSITQLVLSVREYHPKYLANIIDKAIGMGGDIKFINALGESLITELLQAVNTEPETLKEMLEFLISRGVDVTIRNNKGANALELMLIKYQQNYMPLSVVASFIKDVDNVDAKDYWKEVFAQNKAVLEYVLSFVNLSPSYWREEDREGNSPLISLVKALRVVEIDFYGNCCAYIIKEAIKQIETCCHARSINEANNAGNNALMELVVSKGATFQVIIPIARELIKRGLDLSVRNKEGHNLVDLIEQHEQEIWSSSLPFVDRDELEERKQQLKKELDEVILEKVAPPILENPRAAPLKQQEILR